jgi:hypothetical protein
MAFETLEEAFAEVRREAGRLGHSLRALRIKAAGSKYVEINIPKALALVHDIEALIKKAEKDLR